MAEYTAARGFLLDDTEAARLARAFSALERRLGRPVMPQDVVEAAREPRSPFHSHFEWDDTEAARQYRIVQARYIMRSIEVRLVDAPDRPVRAIIRHPDGGFTSTERAVKRRERDVVAAQLQQARADATAYYHRYAAWEAVFAALPPEGQPVVDVLSAARRLAYEA